MLEPKYKIGDVVLVKHDGGNEKLFQGIITEAGYFPHLKGKGKDGTGWTYTVQTKKQKWNNKYLAEHPEEDKYFKLHVYGYSDVIVKKL